MNDWTPIIVAIVAALPGTIVGIAALIQGMKTHSTFNSKMDLMLKVTEAAAFARGAKQEKEAQAIIEAAVITASKKVHDNLNQPN